MPMKDQVHKDLAKLQGELSRLDSAVKHIEDAKELTKQITSNGQNLHEKYSDQLKEVKELTSKYQELVTRTEKLTEKIDKIDFPSRLDKLDASVTGINQGIQNVQTKLENLGTALDRAITNSTKSLLSRIEKNSGEIQTLKILIYVVLGLSTISIILNFVL